MIIICLLFGKVNFSFVVVVDVVVVVVVVVASK